VSLSTGHSGHIARSGLFEPWRCDDPYVDRIKPLIDITVALVVLVLLSPLLLAIALAVCLESSDPCIFVQRRVGKDGHLFPMYKFRTMIDDRRKGRASYSGPERRRTHKSSRDPRVTRVGRLLRKTSLDELPQLFNVLRGEMSLVGPRPELPSIVDRYEPWQHERHLVRPGLTGWWQVSERGKQPMHEHTQFDIEYVRRVSFRLDLEIVVRTVPALLRGTGAF
jgi:lipopolysaccharide/colanic/teichoic acid biosynthesis glycosyltransferase